MVYTLWNNLSAPLLIKGFQQYKESNEGRGAPCFKIFQGDKQTNNLPK